MRLFAVVDTAFSIRDGGPWPAQHAAAHNPLVLPDMLCMDAHFRSVKRMFVMQFIKNHDKSESR